MTLSEARTRYRNATLESLDRDDRIEPTFQTRLVRECRRLRSVPLGSLTVENLRLLIGQGIGLPYLIPFAIERLQENPLAEGDFYPGDLLCALLRVQGEFWKRCPDARTEAEPLAAKGRELAAAQGKIVARSVEEAVEVFAGTAASAR